jgi:hypothetical protein
MIVLTEVSEPACARARERLEPLVSDMRPDLHSSLDLIRALVHVYHNVRYLGVDRRLLGCIETLKEEGVLFCETFESLYRIYLSLGRPPQELRLLYDMLPDHLLDADGKIVWVSDRPQNYRSVIENKDTEEL